MPEVLTRSFLGMSAVDWIVALAVFAGAAGVARIAVTVVLVRAERIAQRTRTDLDDLIVRLLRSTRTLFLLLVAAWLASETMPLTQATDAGMETAVVIGLLIQCALWGVAAVGYLTDRYRRSQLEVDPGGATAIGAMSFIGKVAVWSIAALLILDNLDVDVAALVTGLGIGGIAVALAMQNVLSDLFASLSIVLDKPFVVGDFVVVGEFMGTVEYVGLKSTRIRSLSGEQIVFANSDLLASRLRNYKRMSERRAVFQLGVTYDTPAAKLRRVPEIVRAAVEAQPGTRFDRCHFKSYGASSLDFETVYFMLDPDFNRFMDVQQSINLELFDRFAEEGIEFAFPTRTLFVRSSEREPAHAR
jgi:small-conductance mechanosensitive channel